LDFVYWGAEASNQTPSIVIPDYHSTLLYTQMTLLSTLMSCYIYIIFLFQEQLMAIFKVNPNSTNLIQNNSQGKQMIILSTNSGKQEHKSCLWNYISFYINELLVCNGKISSAVIGPNQNPSKIENEAECKKLWTEEMSCLCHFEPNTENRMQTIRNNRNLMKRREMRRNLFVDKETASATKNETEDLWEPRVVDNDESSFETHKQADDYYWSCNSDNESDDDIFWTPPQSPVHFLNTETILRTEGELDEQYGVFLEG
jgi:hypothetical protein